MSRLGLVHSIAVLRLCLAIIVIVASMTLPAQSDPFPLVASDIRVEPIPLTLVAPGDGRVLELPPLDAVTGIELTDPLTGLVDTEHPFSAVRLSVNAVERQISDLEFQLRDIAGALEVAGFYFDELDPNSFRLFGVPAVEYDPVLEAARSVLNQDENLGRLIFEAGLFDPWGINDVNPMRLRFGLEHPEISGAIAHVKDRLQGHPVSDEEAALALASLSLRVVREKFGLEEIRVTQHPDRFVPMLPNNKRLIFQGGEIVLWVAADGGLAPCDELAVYWRDIEAEGLWTEVDAQFAEELVGREWHDRGALPFVTRTGETVPLIGPALERECDSAREQRKRIVAMRALARLAVASINIEAGLAYREADYPAALSRDFLIESGIRRNRERFSAELAPGQLLFLARSTGIEDGVLTEDDAKEIADIVLVMLEDLKWDNFHFRGNQRRLTESERDALSDTLSKLAINRLGVWSFNGELVNIDELPAAVFVTDLVPGGFVNRDRSLNTYARSFESIDAKIGYALMRLSIGARTKDQKARLEDGLALLAEANFEKRRIATDLRQQWQRLATDLRDLKSDYDFGRIWASEPIRIVDLLVGEDARVKTGDGLLVAEPLLRFRIHVPLESGTGAFLVSLPDQTMLRVALKATGLPPLSRAARRVLLSTDVTGDKRSLLANLYARTIGQLVGSAKVFEHTEDGVNLEVTIDLLPAGIEAASADERALLQELGFSCEDAGDKISCPFPLGAIGGDTIAQVALSASSPEQELQWETDLQWQQSLPQ